jgi:thiamine biosynthesis lipoprotein
MASPCEILLDSESAHDAKAVFAAAEAEVRRIESKYSRYREDSVVCAINRAAGGAALEVDDETAALLDFAEHCYVESGGRFDISSGVLRRAWDFRRAVPPAPAAVEALLPLIGWRMVEWRAPRVRLSQSGMELDFGGFGKEYAADCAAAAIARLGQKHALINLGGDVRALGPRADGSAWQIGIQHPRRAETTIAAIAIAQGALATSGDYERAFELQGRRYSHLLDPATGWPAATAQSASVCAPLCIVAGALATMALLDGEKGWQRLETAGVAYLWIDAKGELRRRS